jgi:hypothetical protein
VDAWQGEPGPAGVDIAPARAILPTPEGCTEGYALGLTKVHDRSPACSAVPSEVPPAARLALLAECAARVGDMRRRAGGGIWRHVPEPSRRGAHLGDIARSSAHSYWGQRLKLTLWDGAPQPKPGGVLARHLQLPPTRNDPAAGRFSVLHPPQRVRTLSHSSQRLSRRPSRIPPYR